MTTSAINNTSKILPGSRKIMISDIKIGTRRREDMGDVQGLADSLEKYGLIHPVVVDDGWNLVAGGRRMAAAALLGWEEIEVRLTGELSERELRVLELEENVRRKDLTTYECSKDMVELSKIKAEEIRTEATTFQSPGDQKVGHRPQKPDSKEKIAVAIGVPKTTLIEAEQHVAAVTKHPELKDLPKKEAIKKAKELDGTNSEKQITGAVNNSMGKEEPEKGRLVTVKNQTPINTKESVSNRPRELDLVTLESDFNNLKERFDKLKLHHWNLQQENMTLQSTINMAHMELLEGKTDEAIIILERVSKYECSQLESEGQ